MDKNNRNIETEKSVPESVFCKNSKSKNQTLKEIKLPVLANVFPISQCIY